jgi:teichuronic acid biosynthesis glycosyltransferase TuaG
MVTIIVTTYNREIFLEKCLKSILSQTFKDFNVIVVSDGYFKETESLIESFDDSRIKLISNIHTGLPAVSRNIGLKYVQTKYVCFCDDDDIWYKDKLAAQVELIEKSNFDIVFTDIFLINSNDITFFKTQSRFIKIYNYLLINSKIGLLLKNYICLSSTLIKSEIVKNITFNESKEFRGTEDYLFWLELLVNKYNFYFLEHKLVKYRIHENNLSQNRNEAYLRTLNILIYLYNKYPKDGFKFLIAFVFYRFKSIFI